MHNRTVSGSEQYRCIALWFSYFHKQNNYQADSCAKRKILKSTIAQIFPIILGHPRTEIQANKDRLLPKDRIGKMEGNQNPTIYFINPYA